MANNETGWAEEASGNDYHTDDATQVLSLTVIPLAAIFALAQFGLLSVLVRARRDKPVQAMGYGFLVILVIGALLGQAYLILVAIQIYDRAVTNWLLCHLQTGLLLLHINLLHAPLASKLWRVSFKIHRAETRLLKIWDGMAVQLTCWQLLACVTLFIAHLWTISGNSSVGERSKCFESQDVSIVDVEQWFYAGQVLLIVLCMIPAPYLIAYVTSSSFSPIFSEWPRLVQSLLALQLCACLATVTFYVTDDNVVLAARFIAVEATTAVTSGVYVWPALQPRVRPRRRRVEERMVQESSLQRQAKLQEHLAMIMQEKHMEHAHRLSALQLRLSLLRTPRQMALLRARDSNAGRFNVYWAELRRDKRLYFFVDSNYTDGTKRPMPPSHQKTIRRLSSIARMQHHSSSRRLNLNIEEGSVAKTSGAMPIFCLELSRVERLDVMEVDGYLLGKPSRSKMRILQLTYADSSMAGAVQAFSELFGTKRSSVNAGSGKMLPRAQGRAGAAATICESHTPKTQRRVSCCSSSNAGAVWQLGFPSEQQLYAWKDDIEKLMLGRIPIPLRPEYQPLRVFVGTWNCGNLEPPFLNPDGSPLSLHAWLMPNGETSPSCDVYALGFQELSGGGAERHQKCSQVQRIEQAVTYTASKGIKWRRRSTPLTKCSQFEGDQGSSQSTPRESKNMSPAIACAAGGVHAVAGALHATKVWKSRMDAFCRRSGEPMRQSSLAPHEHCAPVLPEHMGALIGSILGDEFILLEAVPMYQIHMFVFIRISHIQHVTDVSVSKVPTFRATYNALGTHTTPKVLARRKGGVGVSFSVGRTSYCFIAAHLAAHQGEKGQLQERNRDTVRILRELDLSGAGRDSCVSFDHLFLCGDLNYRLGAAELPDRATARDEGSRYWDEVAGEIKRADWGALYARDQLSRQMQLGKALTGFDDGGALPFPPSFKLSDDPRKGAQVGDAPRMYHKKRIPSYTDRVLTLHAPGTPKPVRVAQGAAHGIDASDHAPVWAIFESQCLLQSPPIDELDFEEQWYLRLLSLSVRVNIGELREGRGDTTTEGGWEHCWGDRWLGGIPALRASLEGNFLSRGRERLSAPLPPGTIVQGEGSSLELLARWEGAEFALSLIASQHGLEWLQVETLTIHIYAGEGNVNIPLGSARFGVAEACRLTRMSVAGLAADSLCTTVQTGLSHLSWCGVRCGELETAFCFKLTEAAVLAATPLNAHRPPPVSVHTPDRCSADSAASPAGESFSKSPAGSRLCRSKTVNLYAAAKRGANRRALEQ
ncbi:hypothetical protein AB1Y20_011285 [Prymnesium parvum]|uniref:Inositol polyphosphate-related phosphatase domain-containing protein n=1 Tax=Prymnesium parvum TaxID=97485 RepID=A0AB34IP42_PRYPA